MASRATCLGTQKLTIPQYGGQFGALQTALKLGFFGIQGCFIVISFGEPATGY